ncbi:unnamed protein product [Clonostachys rhizophaga]|uniref:Xylanolytic transcriptional activator regulatory domain-containing protein n=1 Tax=Clonostachys rhizophaga TaxID=160324 RepID=A0A9N9YJ17_9HYPO|nr:unnamed protein product [Clonostachys rhizophaga]
MTGMTGCLRIRDHAQLHFFGAQSSHHLVHDFSNSDEIRHIVTLQQNGLLAVERLGLNVSLPIALPTHLLELYWRWQHPSTYLFHKKLFCEAFQNRTYGKYCTPLLLSAIFALASRFSDRPELRAMANDTETAGQAFFEQAKVLFLHESQAPTVATIQAAALMSLRALSDGHEALGWLYGRNATRMALNLGLNIDCSPWVAAGVISEDDAEVRKITWWGCVYLNKLVLFFEPHNA